MEIALRVINLFLGIILIRLCSGFPIGLENSAADFHTQFMTGLVGVLLIVCGIVFLIGCLCCQRQNGFKEFQNGPVVASSTSSLDHGHINPIANGEFTIFTPLSPPHHNNNAFLANEQIIGSFITEIDYNHADIDVNAWFDGREGDFPRTKLKYIKEIGRGWFGRVVEGAAQGLNETDDNWTPVAVRILEASATSTERAVFLHDAAIYRCGKHPHILKLLGRCLESVPLLLLQELFPCGDLKKYLKENQSTAKILLSSELPLLWSCQISSALKHLHDHRLTHPDLAARNCQVVSERTLKLGDYGLAASLYPNDYYQGAPAVPVRWSAPESLTYTSTTIQPKKITLASNIWSFGVTLWEIFEPGAQPYAQLNDDDVISQVIGSGSVRLAKPTFSILYTDYLFRLMQLCWSTSESRPSISQVHLMLSDLLQVYQNSKQVLNSEPLTLLQDFDKRWESFKPNSVARTDNQDFLQDSKSLADIDLSDVSILNLSLNKEEELLYTKPMSPSLNNLHGSLDNLANDEMDSWLQKVAHKTGDMSYVRGLSEAINDLDKALALENVSSSDSSHQPSPAPENVTTNKLEFQLGPTIYDTCKTEHSSLTESMQRTSSESETEDENWRRKIEQGAYSEKVHQKSKSVADLMILTHIDYSESDSETPLPSLDYRVNYKNVRYAPKHNLENVSLMFGSEGNLLSVHDKFQEELRRLQEERKDSLLFVPEYNCLRDNDTSKSYDDKLDDIGNSIHPTENQSNNCTYVDMDKFTSTDQYENTFSQTSSPNRRNPESLIEELSNPTDIQPANQIYNVFNITVDTSFSPKHIRTDLRDIIRFEENSTKANLTDNIKVSPVRCFNVPKLTELIQNNDDLIDYIINHYETDEDLNIKSNPVATVTENLNKELNNNIHNTDIVQDSITSTNKFLENEREVYESAKPQVKFDIGVNQEEVSPNNMTHLAVFTSTPFVKRTLDKTISDDVGTVLQFSSNFDESDTELKYSLETWDNFLGEAMEDPNKCLEFNDFESEPPSLLFIEGDDAGINRDNGPCLKTVIQNDDSVDYIGEIEANDENKTFVALDETVNGNDKTFTVGESAANKTATLDSPELLNKTHDLNFTYEAPTDKWQSGEGWYLHPQSNTAVSGQMEICESYIGFSVDDEIVAALRNELLMKLPQAQGQTIEQVKDADDWDAEERNEVLIKYNVYNAPLSPIPEESYSEVSHNFIYNRRNSTDSENEDWSEPYEEQATPVPETETISVQNIESPMQEPPHRHTPSQDSCCSNDTLFNLEELTCGFNENDVDRKSVHSSDDCLNKTITLRSERKQETEENQAKTEYLILNNLEEITNNDFHKFEEAVGNGNGKQPSESDICPMQECEAVEIGRICSCILEELVYNLPTNGDEKTEADNTSHLDNIENVTAAVENNYLQLDVDVNHMSNNVSCETPNFMCDNLKTDFIQTSDCNGDINNSKFDCEPLSENELVHKIDIDNRVNGISVCASELANDIDNIALFINYERQNCIFESDSVQKNDLITPTEVDPNDIDLMLQQPDYINVDELNRLKLEVDYVNVNELENMININNQSDYVNVNERNMDENDPDIYEALTDIRFTGPTDMQIMSTSFSESVDLDEQDWDSGSDTRSSSSGEFIWKEGEHEESVKALRAAPQDLNSNEKYDIMDDLNEASTESSDEDEDGDSPEFVPSAWDKYATPTKSALRSPEKTMEKSEVKAKKQKGVWFKKQKYHCVYEYPKEPESPVVNSNDLWQPVSSSLIDWEVDTSPYIPTMDASNSHSDLYKHTRNIYLGDFTTAGLDDEFYISSTAQPFETFAVGLASQFFPGQSMSGPWMDLTKQPYENITPDSGVEDITPAGNSDSNEFPCESVKPQLHSLKALAASVLKQNQLNNLKHNTKDCLGGLRHARNKLKLDLPPSPNAFTVAKVFTIEPEEEPITKQEVPTFTTFGKSRFLVQHVDTPTPDEENHSKNVSFEALPYKPLQIIKGDKAKVETRGEASLLDSADEDSGIESSTLERRKITTKVDVL